jgi:hypothetical protein
MARQRDKQRAAKREKADKLSARRSIERVRRYEKQQLLEEVRNAAEAANSLATEAKKPEYGGQEQSFPKQVSGAMVLRTSEELHVCKHGVFAMLCVMLLECCHTYAHQLCIVCG